MEELKVELLTSINKVRDSLAIIASCRDELDKLVPMEDVVLVRSWFDAIEEDIQNRILPDFQLKKTLDDLISTGFLTFNKTREGLIDEVRRFESDRNRDGGIPSFNMVRYASNHYYVYKVLRAIGFAQRNTVIVGPNGSGKTTLANCFTTTIRQSTGIVIPAQKLLFIPHVIGIPLPEEVDRTYANYQSNPRDTKQTYDYRNGSDLPLDLVRRFGDEMQNVILKFSSDIQSVKTNVFHAVRSNKGTDSHTKADTAIEIWNDLMMERKLVLDSYDHFAVEYQGSQYPAYKMSEGERNILYLIGRVLFAPNDGYIIVDEPELYLHKTIVNKLWDRLERERSDCKFIYLTHDLDFAVTRNAKKCWIRRFDYPNRWDILPIHGSKIPEDLLMRILGSRKKILFCEGTKDSFDIKFFEFLFPSYTIIPAGSCEEVISYTRAFNRYPNRLADAYGIIDRDVRPQAQLDAFKADRIYSYDVAEIENLFLVEDFLTAFVHYYHFESQFDMSLLKQKVIDAFRLQIDKHALDHVTSTINFYYREQRLHTAKTYAELQASYDQFKSLIDTQKVYDERKAYLVDVCDKGDYNAVLRLINNKGLSSIVSSMLGMKYFQTKAIEFLHQTDAVKYLRGLFPLEL
jgi:energy-coupling factor transporter ATP-binding protein EcfA2